MLPDWIEPCGSFNAHRVEYVLVGGQAVIAHGYPRLTKELDLWVRPTEANGARFLEALEAYGSAPTDFAPERFEDPRTLVMLGREPFRIDLLTDLPACRTLRTWKRSRRSTEWTRRRAESAARGDVRSASRSVCREDSHRQPVGLGTPRGEPRVPRIRP